MLMFLKVIVTVFVLAGLAFAVYGGRKTYILMREEKASPSGKNRRGYYVLPSRYLAIFGVGLGFIIIPLLVWIVGVRALDSPAGVGFIADSEEYFAEILAWKAGPVSVLHMFYAFAGLFALPILLSIIQKIFKR